MYLIVGGSFDDDPELITTVDLGPAAAGNPDGTVTAELPIAVTTSQIVVRVAIANGQAQRTYYIRVTQNGAGVSANPLFTVPA